MRTTWGTWRAWAALVVALSACGPAHAFYFEGWPGSGIARRPSLMTTLQVEPSPGDTSPVDTPPVGPTPTPTPTPEPATGALGLLGLGALAVRRWRAKR